MRAIGIDVHRDFCEVAISEGGQLRSAGRVPSTPADLELLAQSLGPDDEVALETTGNALAIARILGPHVSRVVVASAKELHAISGAKAKTDRRDARTLAKLLGAGMLQGTWLPDEETRALRRRLSRRAQLVRQRVRLKNEIHAALYRNLKGAGPATDLFGTVGRRWLAELALPADERETVAGCLRVLDFLGGEARNLRRHLRGDVPELGVCLDRQGFPGVDAEPAGVAADVEHVRPGCQARQSPAVLPLIGKKARLVTAVQIDAKPQSRFEDLQRARHRVR